MSAMKRVLVLSRFLFLSLVFLSLYLIVASRSGEVHTVWEFMNPFFVPVFFVMTLFLVVIGFSAERVRYKLVWAAFYSFVGRCFFAVIFPAGSLGSQQSVLGVTRLLYDGVILYGWGGRSQTFFLRIYSAVDRPNFQSAYTIMFARMLGVDVFWVHLFFLPVLWGLVVPVLVFLIARALGLSDGVAVLSGVLASAFPLLVFWGTLTVPMGLGYVFFLSSLYFGLRYLRSGGSGALAWTILLAFASFLSHFLSGIMAFGFLVLAFSLRRYEDEKATAPLAARLLVLISFVFAVVLLPLTLNYLHLISPVIVYFSLDKIAGLTPVEVAGLALFGQYVNYEPFTALISVAGPVLGFFGVVYTLYESRRGKVFAVDRVLVLFVFLGFLVAFIDYRILKLFTVNLPFSEERIWVFRDFVLVPFAAFVVAGAVGFTDKLHRINMKSFGGRSRNLLRMGLRVFFLLLIGGWVVTSVFSVYPRFSPLQITSSELDAVRYLKTESQENYVVVGDQYIDLAGGMLVGIHNPRAYYFSYTDEFGVELFNHMQTNPSINVMIEALDYVNATIGYFVVNAVRLGQVEFDRVVSAALNNGLQLLPVSFGDGEVVVFRYEKF